MDISSISYSMIGLYTRSQPYDRVHGGSFSEAIKEYTGTGVRASTNSTIDDYIKKHPNEKAQVDRLLNPGLKVIKQYVRSDAEVEEMSMDEYKRYIYDILDKLPYDTSQLRDTEFIDITEKGWEQMKKDPKYEAWVVGYFKVDRSVKIPFANYPGVEPRIHTEHFGASIEEHIGQSYPQSMSTGKERDSEDWWKKRQKRHDQYMEQAEQYAARYRMDQKELMSRAWECLFARGSRNTWFDFAEDGMSVMSAAVEFLMMSGGMTGGTHL